MAYTLKEKTEKYILPQQVMEMGIYPFFRVLESDQDTEIMFNGKKVLMFGSNSYLGLTNHPKIKEAAKNAIEKYGTGCAGSRFLNGTIDLHIELEKKLAEFVGKEEALVFSTGFQANLGAISALTGRNDYILIDEHNHASIIDGCRLSFSETVKFRHNDMQSLEEKLKSLTKPGLRLIIVDGVFSMEGDIANLPDIVALAKKYKASVMVDEAHSLGVLGKYGQGSAAHFGLTDDVEIIMGTFSKSLSTIGGFIAGDAATINYLRHHSRTLIFSASITPASAASVIAALEIIMSEPERIEQLWRNTNYAINALRNAGLEIGKTETPIIPIYVRNDIKTFMLTKLLADEGVFVNPVIPPAVSSEDTLIRFSVMATHTIEQIDTAISKIVSAVKQLESVSYNKINYDQNY